MANVVAQSSHQYRETLVVREILVSTFTLAQHHVAHVHHCESVLEVVEWQVKIFLPGSINEVGLRTYIRQTKSGANTTIAGEGKCTVQVNKARNTHHHILWGWNICWKVLHQ